MWAGVTTIVVEPRFIVRAALASLLGKLTYRVVCGVATMADLSSATGMDGCKLAVLGARSAEDGATEAADVRKLWPDCKILLLLETTSCVELQKLMASPIDGCVPLDASAETLSKTLELIIAQGLRVMVASGAKLGFMQTTSEDADEPGCHLGKPLSGVIEGEALSIMMADIPDTTGNSATLTSATSADESVNGVPSLRKRKLSDREVQILDSLVKGHANKVIARTCDISEATVKVHMKSILRKIQVANRTQAAVWALEHGYCCDDEI